MDEPASAEDGEPLSEVSPEDALAAEAEPREPPSHPRTVLDDEALEAIATFSTASRAAASGEDFLASIAAAEVDLDAVLAAAAISDAHAQEEAEERRTALKPTAYIPMLPMPPLTTLQRGQLGSLVPGLLLVGGGAWLTFSAIAGRAVAPEWIAAGVSAGVLLSLLAYSLGNRLWTRGLVFVVIAALLIGGVFALGLLPGGIDLTRGYPLLIGALGLAVILSAVLARPAYPRLIPAGIVLIAASAAALAITSGYISSQLLSAAAPYWPVVVVVIVLLWLLPLVIRRRS